MTFLGSMIIKSVITIVMIVGCAQVLGKLFIKDMDENAE